MATAKIDTVIRQLRRAMLRQVAAGKTDGQLLASFIEQKDEAAFEALVHRHGPMVFGVCRRVIGNYHDAEDAFQATFLVLARKASSVRPREKVANWLHGVALRTALKVKATTLKRRRREKQVTEMPEPEAVQQDQWRDLQPLLDQELNGLPENYRLPILLCDLEGKTIKEAAQQLGWPQGTVAGRLARSRKLLSKRLTKRGVALSAGSLAVIVSQNAASAGVPTSLMSSTVKAATMIAAGQAAVAGVVPAKVATLTEGVLKAMLLTKLKSVVAVMIPMVVTVSIGAGLLAYGPAAGHQSEGKKSAAVASSLVPAKRIKETGKGKLDEGDLVKLQGTWSLMLHHWKGHENDGGPATLTVKGNACTVVWEKGTKKAAWRIKLDPAKQPKQIDFLGGGDQLPGIYKLEGTTLLICQAQSGKDRPSTFAAEAEGDDALFVFRRLTPADGANEKPVKPFVTVQQSQGNKDIPDEGNERQAKRIGKPTEKSKSIPSSDDLRGLWEGEKNGIEVKFTFSGDKAHWHVEYRKTRKPKKPYESAWVGVGFGADLKCVPDEKGGRWSLYLPAYLGDDPKIKKYPVLTGHAPVGEITRGAEGTIQLRIIPTGWEDLDRDDYDYPAVKGLILRRKKENGEQVKADKELLQGTWVLVSQWSDGKENAKEELKKIGRKVTFSGERFVVTESRLGQTRRGSYKINPKEKPKSFDVTITVEKGLDETKVIRAIYKIEGDTLTICERKSNDRPVGFTTEGAGAGNLLSVFKREKSK